jgi:hypothetical protein
VIWLAGFARGAYYFFVEDGSIVIGAIVALVLVGVLAIWKPFGSAALFAGPLLFLLIAALLVANLLHVAHQARGRR